MQMKSTLRNLKICFLYSWKHARLQYLISALSIITGTVQPLVMIIAPAKIIDALVSGKKYRSVLVWIIVLVAVEISTGLINHFVNYASKKCEYYCGLSHKEAYFESFLNMDYEKLEDGLTKDLGAKVHKNMFPTFFPKTLANFITNVIQLASYTYIIATLHPLIILVIIIIIFVSSKLSKISEKTKYEFEPIITKASRRFNYLFSIMINYEYGKEIRINNFSGWLKKRYSTEIGNYMRQFRKRQKKEIKVSIISALITVVQTVIMYGYCSYKAIFGYISIGEFSMHLGAITAFIGCFSGIFSKINELKIKSSYAEDYLEFLEIAKPNQKKV